MEIHDHLNATLIGLRAQTEHIGHLARPPHTEDKARAIRERVKVITEAITSLYISARALQKQLRPEVIDILGLKGALQELVSDYGRSRTDIEFSLIVMGDFPNLNHQLAITAYRLVQEALSNVVKHAQASLAIIKIESHDASQTVRISVSDDGVGFSPKATPQFSLGLVGMRERVSAIGGTMNIESSHESGTAVVFIFPLMQNQFVL
jgi:two-component system, NarL family, sensor histidine kinase UhpB